MSPQSFHQLFIAVAGSAASAQSSEFLLHTATVEEMNLES